MYLFKRIIFKFFPQLMKSKDYVEYLNKKGVKIGKGTYFFGPATTEVDIQRPWMLSIGEYCKITNGVKILCHDYSRSVLRRVYGEVIGEAKETIIGDNVFIGVNSIILMGSNIGNNVIIGAGSVVSGNVPSNVVIAGNPARIIRTLEEHYEIRNKETLNEAKLWVKTFNQMYNRNPKVSEMGPFWQLFLERDVNRIKEAGVLTDMSGDCEEEVIKSFLNSKPIFSSYDDFVEKCNF